MSFESNGAERRPRSLAASEQAIRHQEETLPNSLFRQFKELEAQINEKEEEVSEAQIEYESLVELGVDPARQQDPRLRTEDITRGRAAKETLERLAHERDDLVRQKDAIEAKIRDSGAGK